MNILAIDLGKFKSVACLFKTETNEAEFETIVTYRWAIQQLLEQTQPDRVVIETCSISGWVNDLCQELGYAIEVANPSQEAWKWKHIKRKTDKDDALKLSRLSALAQKPWIVPIPGTTQMPHLLENIGEFGRRKSNGCRTRRTEPVCFGDPDSWGTSARRSAGLFRCRSAPEALNVPKLLC